MKILIETIPHSEQRYPTTGDWQWEPADPEEILRIRVSKTPDWRTSALVAIHELVEALLCKHAKVSEAAVDKFDIGYSGYFSEPGADPAAPYHDAHMFAERVEKSVARELNIRWSVHVDELNNLVDTIAHKPHTRSPRNR